MENMQLYIVLAITAFMIISFVVGKIPYGRYHHDLLCPAGPSPDIMMCPRPSPVSATRPPS